MSEIGVRSGIKNAFLLVVSNLFAEDVVYGLIELENV